MNATLKQTQLIKELDHLRNQDQICNNSIKLL